VDDAGVWATSDNEAAAFIAACFDWSSKK
jgi:hypothetical protein